MKRKSYILALLSAMLSVATQAFAVGESCSNPIMLTPDYSETITKTGTIWYCANTFDLPLSIVFYPTDESADPPELYLDFSCTPGVYTDPILCNLFCISHGSYITMPYKQVPNKTYDEHGKAIYKVEFGQFYRDMLLSQGIDYNVPVFVKVVFSCGGELTMAPDAFGNCMDGYKFMHLGDTIRVQADDMSRHVIVPYIQWQRDSIRYVWDGTAPLQLSVATECEFDPYDNGNRKIVNFEYLTNNKDTFKLTSAQLQYYVNGGEYSSEAGMFFAKWHSAESGTLKVERIPMAPPQGGATLLQYDKATDVTASDTTVKTYAIPFTWTEAVKFITPTNHIFKMYIGTKHDFLPQQAIDSCQFYPSPEGHWYGIQASEMENLWAQTTAKYLYIKIWCTEPTTITPVHWSPSPCADAYMNYYLPPKDTVIKIARKTSETRVFRLNYAQWKGGSMTFSFDKAKVCNVFISDTCKFNVTNSSATFANLSVESGKPKTITAEEIAAWEPQVIDEDGFIYMRLYCKDTNGNVTITTTAPEEQDPAPIVYPAATVDVTCGEKEADGAQNVSVKVSVEQDIMIYDSSANIVDSWHQKPTDAPHSLKLQPGDYSLVGNGEKIAILIKN